MSVLAGLVTGVALGFVVLGVFGGRGRDLEPVCLRCRHRYGAHRQPAGAMTSTPGRCGENYCSCPEWTEPIR